MIDESTNLKKLLERNIFDEIKFEVTPIGNDEDCTFDDDYDEEYERIIEDIFGE